MHLIKTSKLPKFNRHHFLILVIWIFIFGVSYRPWDTYQLDWRIKVVSCPVLWHNTVQERDRITVRNLRYYISIVSSFWLFLLCATIWVFQEFLKHRILMLTSYMIFKRVLLHLLAAFSTLKQFFRAFFYMNLNITFLDSCSTRVRAFDFEFTDYFIQAHIGSESTWQLFLTVRACLLSQLSEAAFTNDSTALFTIKGYIWKIKANDAFQLFEC